jgi:galactonate dehydratase
MKISRIDTIRLAEFPNLLYVLVHDGDGRVGLGETFYGAAAVEAWVHETAAPLLLGQDPRRIDALNHVLTGYVGYSGSGAETRGRSAVDIALWDLLGQLAGQPLYTLLGGQTRDRVRIYNTCAGYRYVRQHPVQSVANWGMPTAADRIGPYEDLDGFLYRADELAASLLDEGVTAMKIWPFDLYAEATGGRHIGLDALHRAVEPLRRIRAAVGSQMEVMVEFHALWDRPTARQIMTALAEFDISWYEDPLRADDVEGLAQLARQTTVPLAVGETVTGLAAYRRLCEQGAAGVVVVDAGWVGGLTEARKVAALAEAYGLPLAPHDCTGPVGLTVGVHLSTSQRTAAVQETVRAHYTTWYPQLVSGLPAIDQGTIAASDAPGLGVALRPEVLERPDATIRSAVTGTSA